MKRPKTKQKATKIIQKTKITPAGNIVRNDIYEVLLEIRKEKKRRKEKEV